MAEQIVSNHTPAPTPVKGDFTDDSSAHIARASAMATIVTGEGYEAFKTWNDETQHHYLWALSAEIDHAKAALGAESARRLAEREARS